MAKEKDTRTRNWSVIIYPDSAPDNWRDLIDDLHIEWVESPLHDKDISGDGSPKKPHWHILLLFGGVKSYEQVCEFLQPLNCPIPQRCHNTKSLVRYMAHLDNPDKAKYDQSKIVSHGGVDIADLVKPSSAERYTLIKEMMQHVHDMAYTELYELIDYAMEFRYDDWFPLLCDSSAYVLNSYIKSQKLRSQATQFASKCSDMGVYDT